MNKISSLFVIALMCLLPDFVFASVPVGGGTFPIFAQLPDTDQKIKGMRLNPGWGYHKSVYGLDLSAVGGSTYEKFVGMQMAGVFNDNAGKAIVTGWQAAGALNRNAGLTHIAGLQLTLGVNSAAKAVTNIYGGQVALIANIGDNMIHGLQSSIYNQAKAVYGVQVGVMNNAEVVRGVQLGVVNKAKSLRGIQLGLANFSKEGGAPFLPIINVGF